MRRSVNETWLPQPKRQACLTLLTGHLIRLTPIGSSMEDVRRVLQSEHWTIYYDRKLYHTTPGYPGVKGNYAIGADLGQHVGLPFPYVVDAYWGFDKTNRMVDLRVRVSALGAL